MKFYVRQKGLHMKVLCVLSDHRAHKSKSPRMHNAVIRALGLQEEYLYVPFQIDPACAGDAVAALRTLHVAGANVTVPCKELVIPHLDRLSPEAASVGAVNTIVPEEGGLAGYNTDIGGVQDALEFGQFELTGQTALLCGTGGAARGVLQALKGGGAARILLAGRDPAKTAALAQEFNAKEVFGNQFHGSACPEGFGCSDCGGCDTREVDSQIIPLDIKDPAQMQQAALEAALIINTTAVSDPAESPELAAVVAGLRARSGGLVMDINYGRKENLWQALAQRSDARFLDGLPMLAMQAARSFRLWTGIPVTGHEFLAPLMKS